MNVDGRIDYDDFLAKAMAFGSDRGNGSGRDFYQARRIEYAVCLIIRSAFDSG